MKKQFLLLVATLFALQAIQAQNLVSATLAGSKTKEQLLTQFSIPFINFGVKYYKISYTTHTVQNMPDTATGLLVIPNDLTRVFPRLVYQHGTSGSKQDVPSLNFNGGEGSLGLLFGGLGYVSVLPDYLGLGTKSKGFHPYVHADSEAWAAEDMLRAVDEFLQQNNVLINDQLFITGYSQGGHAAMALHRDIELNYANEFNVTAAAPLSGPYSIGEVMRALILTNKIYYYPAYIPNSILSYQTVYGNIYSSISDVFKPAYAGMIQQFYNNQMTLTNLNIQLIAKITAEEGECRPIKMFKDSILNVIETDLTHPLNLALKDNNTYTNWIPKAPTRIFYCMADDQVPFENSVLAFDSLMAAGAFDLQKADVNSTADHGACYTPAMTNTLLFFLSLQQVGSVSTEEVAKQDQFITPSLASTYIQVEITDQVANIEVFDNNGQAVLRRKISGGIHQIDVSDYASGIYYVRLYDQSGIRVQKIMIER